MATRIHRAKSHAIFLEEDDLRALWNFLSHHYSKIEYEASCRDGSTLTGENIDALLALENPRTRMIEGLKLTFRRAEFEERGSVEFSDAGFRTSACTVNGTNDPDTLYIANELTRMLGEYRPWYSVLRWLSPWVLVWLGSLAFFVYSAWNSLLTTGNVPKGSDVSLLELVSVFYVLLPFLLAGALVFVLSRKAWDWLFPQLWFAIGRQKAAFARKQVVRRWVFGGIILAAAVGLMVNWISAALLKR